MRRLRLSFVLSVIYLMQNQLLRDHHLGSIVLAISGAGSAGADEPQQRAGGPGFACGRDGVRIVLGASHLWALLEWRSEGDHHAGDSGGLCRLLVAWPDDGVARRAGFGAVRGQFLFVLFSYSIVNLYLSSFHRFF